MIDPVRTDRVVDHANRNTRPRAGRKRSQQSATDMIRAKDVGLEMDMIRGRIDRTLHRAERGRPLAIEIEGVAGLEAPVHGGV